MGLCASGGGGDSLAESAARAGPRRNKMLEKAFAVEDELDLTGELANVKITIGSDVTIRDDLIRLCGDYLTRMDLWHYSMDRPRSATGEQSSVLAASTQSVSCYAHDVDECSVPAP